MLCFGKICLRCTQHLQKSTNDTRWNVLNKLSSKHRTASKNKARTAGICARKINLWVYIHEKWVSPCYVGALDSIMRDYLLDWEQKRSLESTHSLWCGCLSSCSCVLLLSLHFNQQRISDSNIQITKPGCTKKLQLFLRWDSQDMVPTIKGKHMYRL